MYVPHLVFTALVLMMFSNITVAFGLNVDGNSGCSPNSDGRIIKRYLADQESFNVIGITSTISNAEIKQILASGYNNSLDIDADGKRLTTTDGVLIRRFLKASDTFTTTGATTTNTAISTNQIINNLRSIYFNCPTSFKNSTQDFDMLDVNNINPGGIWSDGTTMWVADWGSDMIFAYNLITKDRNLNQDFDDLDDGNTNPFGIWSDGTTMWVADWMDARIYAYSLATKIRDAGKDFSLASNRVPNGIWSDGTTMWVADGLDSKIFAYNLATKAPVPSQDFNTLENSLTGIWSDGTTMWVSNNTGKIFAYNLATKIRDVSRDFGVESQTRDIWSNGAIIWLITRVFQDPIFAYDFIAAPEPPLVAPDLTTVDATTILIEWNYAGSEIDFYQFCRSTSSQSSNSSCISAESGANRVVDTGLAPQTSYRYWLRACNLRGGCSAFSPLAVVNTPANP